jgi:hypothetical protein
VTKRRLRPPSLSENSRQNRETLQMVEMGGIEPPSRTLSHRPTTSLVGVLVSTGYSHRQDYQVEYRIVLDSPYPVVWRVAPRLGVTRSQTGRGAVWAGVATILCGEGEFFFASYCCAPFYVAWATTACSLCTYGPVEASHPRAVANYSRFRGNVQRFFQVLQRNEPDSKDPMNRPL